MAVDQKAGPFRPQRAAECQDSVHVRAVGHDLAGPGVHDVVKAQFQLRVLAEGAEGFGHGLVGVEDGQDVGGAERAVPGQLLDAANGDGEGRCWVHGGASSWDWPANIGQGRQGGQHERQRALRAASSRSMRARVPPSTLVPAGTGANSAPSVAGAGGAVSTCERWTRSAAAWSLSGMVAPVLTGSWTTGRCARNARMASYAATEGADR